MQETSAPVSIRLSYDLFLIYSLILLLLENEQTLGIIDLSDLSVFFSCLPDLAWAVLIGNPYCELPTAGSCVTHYLAEVTTNVT